MKEETKILISTLPEVPGRPIKEVFGTVATVLFGAPDLFEARHTGEGHYEDFLVKDVERKGYKGANAVVDVKAAHMGSSSSGCVFLIGTAVKLG